MFFDLNSLIVLALTALLLSRAIKIWRHRPAPQPRCMWLQDTSADTVLTVWICQVCGEQAFCIDCDAPSECKKTLRVMM